MTQSHFLSLCLCLSVGRTMREWVTPAQHGYTVDQSAGTRAGWSVIPHRAGLAWTLLGGTPCPPPLPRAFNALSARQTDRPSLGFVSHARRSHCSCMHAVIQPWLQASSSIARLKCHVPPAAVLHAINDIYLGLCEAFLSQILTSIRQFISRLWITWRWFDYIV